MIRMDVWSPDLTRYLVMLSLSLDAIVVRAAPLCWRAFAMSELMFICSVISAGLKAKPDGIQSSADDGPKMKGEACVPVLVCQPMGCVYASFGSAIRRISL